MFLYLVEENKQRPWQLKLFIRVDKTEDLVAIENELFKRRWKCIKWMESKKSGYNYFTYVQKPKNHEREQFVQAIDDILINSARIVPYNNLLLFELIETGQIITAMAMLKHREVQLSETLMEQFEEENADQFGLFQREYVSQKVELERFWAFCFFKSELYAECEKYFENAELERESLAFLPSLENDTISLYYRILCSYFQNDYINVFKLGKCWLDRYLAIQESCWLEYVSLPDVENQVGDVFNMLSKTLKHYGSDIQDIENLISYRGTLIQNHKLLYCFC